MLSLQRNDKENQDLSQPLLRKFRYIFYLLQTTMVLSRLSGARQRFPPA